MEEHHSIQQTSAAQMEDSPIPREMDLTECHSDEWKFLFDHQHGEVQASEFKMDMARDSSIQNYPGLCSGRPSGSKPLLPQLSSDIVERVFPVRSIVSFDSKSSALHTTNQPLDNLEFSAFSLTDDDSEEFGEALLARSSGVSSQEQMKPKRPTYTTRMDLPRRQFSGLSSRSVLPTLQNPTPFLNKTHSPMNDTWRDSSLDEQLRDTIAGGGSILSTKILSKELGNSNAYEDLSIQSLGVLLVIYEYKMNFVIQIVSDNSKEILGYSCEELFEQKSICNILDPSHRAIFKSHTEVVLSDDFDPEVCGPEVFPISVLTSGAKTRGMWCTMHTSKLNRGYVICEIEPDTDNRHQPPKSEDSVQYCPWIRDDVQVSMDAAQDKQLFASELLNVLPCVLQQMSSAQSLEILIQQTVSSLQQLTEFDRVGMYRFENDGSGVVIADSMNPSFNMESFEGIRFDNSIFSLAMKKNYLRSGVAFSYRKSRGAARLISRDKSIKIGLDLAHCYLPTTLNSSQPHHGPQIHACMSIGLHISGKLWGLISCLSYTESFSLQPPLQRVCWILGDVISSNIERLSYTLPFQIPENGSPVGDNPFKAPSSLLALFKADYAAACVLDETKILGNPADSQEALAMLEYLRAKKPSTVLWSSDIASDFEDLDYSPGFHYLAGFLFVPLSTDGTDFIIFFRGVGSTEKCQIYPQTEWSAADFGQASTLSMLYRAFSEVWQEREATRQSNQLVRLLLASSAHEFRTPLNAIINYLEIELDKDLNQETRKNLSRSHSASKSLVYIINDLLDLTHVEHGQMLIKNEVFSLSETLREATNIFYEEALQKKVTLRAVQHSHLPQVLGDQRRVRQVITNLISNAVQHTTDGAITIESRILIDPHEVEKIVVEVAIHDTGTGMSRDAVETLFRELEQVSCKDYIQDTECYKNKSYPSRLGTGSVLGLGLALVARIVRNMDGQLSLRSKEGKGSCFKLRLKFPTSSHDSASISSFNEWDSRSSEVSYDTISCKNESPEKEVNIAHHFDDITLSESSQWRESDLFVNVQNHIDCKNGELKSLFTADRLRDYGSVRSQGDRLNILVAEDDPINSSIVKKRLEKLGYSVCMTRNGRECAARYRESPEAFDVVLMDLQMPIVDGLSATKMIRDYELQILKQPKLFQIEPGHRIAIFAVSASLMEKHWPIYVDVGFDGWITKPIDFQRVNSLLKGVKSTDYQKTCVYQPGKWEYGGWFES